MLCLCFASTLSKHFVKTAMCMPRNNTFPDTILHTQRYASLINEAEFLSSDRLVRLLIFQLLTYSCGKANLIFLLFAPAVLVRQWVICGGQKPGKQRVPLPAIYLLFLAAIMSQPSNVLFSFSVFLVALSFAKDSKHTNCLGKYLVIHKLRKDWTKQIGEKIGELFPQSGRVPASRSCRPSLLCTSIVYLLGSIVNETVIT